MVKWLYLLVNNNLYAITYQTQMNKFNILIIFLLLNQSCKKQEDQIINENTVFEFRINEKHYEGKLEIITNESVKFERLKNYFKSLKDFKKVSHIKNYPQLILKSENIIIYINQNQIDVEYENSKKEVVKLSKEFNSYDAFLEFQYLWDDGNWIIDFGEIYGIGYLKVDKYLRCGLKSDEINYFYKVGEWRFWNLDKQLIAKGEFEIDSIKTSVIGVNCENTIKLSKINDTKWDFYDKKGNKIEPTIELKHTIESAKYDRTY